MLVTTRVKGVASQFPPKWVTDYPVKEMGYKDAIELLHRSMEETSGGNHAANFET